ncbi:MAG: hypothetical protein AB1777_05385 [Bacteroidota bacterium]
MGTPCVKLPRDTIRHACGVAHVVSLTRPTATFHPRPIAGSGFYASACLFRSISSQGYGLAEAKKSERDRRRARTRGVRSYPTNNEQRFQPRRGEIFVTQWLLSRVLRCT